jgi:hypothetical protein
MVLFKSLSQTALILQLTNSKDRVLSEKLIVPQLVKKFSALYETRMFITALITTATCPYPEPDLSSLCPHPILNQAVNRLNHNENVKM